MTHTEPKSFDFYNNNRPKVLLIGNGINRACDGPSWNELLDKLKAKKFDKPAEKYNMPMPLKAVMLSENHLASGLMNDEEHKSDKRYGKLKDFFTKAQEPISDEQKDLLQRILDLNFDYVLTTNYGYELEAAALGSNCISIDDAIKLRCTLEKEDESEEKDKKKKKRTTNESLIKTYNSCVRDGHEAQIWHIHGEMGLPGNMILGHLYYGKLLHKCIDICSPRRALYMRHKRDKRQHTIESWVEALLWGDVYVVGLSLGFSEIDLWWLLEKKADYGDGTVVFYEPKPSDETVCPLKWDQPCSIPKEYVDEKQCKLEMMKVFGIEIDDRSATAQTNEEFKAFYEKVYQDLQDRLLSIV